jgi:hypothetical protein
VISVVYLDGQGHALTTEEAYRCVRVSIPCTVQVGSQQISLTRSTLGTRATLIGAAGPRPPTDLLDIAACAIAAHAALLHAGKT